MITYDTDDFKIAKSSSSLYEVITTYNLSMNGDNIKINVSLRHVDRWAAKDQLTWKSNILSATKLLCWYFKTGFICTS